jgi:hypothetical protein
MAGSHNHIINVSVNGNHSHTATIYNDGQHTHDLVPPLLDDSGTSIQGQSNPSDADPVNNTQPAGDHTHNITIDTGGNHNHTVDLAGAGDHSHSVSILPTGISETRPRNLAMKFYIKISTPKILEPVVTSNAQSISGQKTFNDPIVVAPIPQAIIFGDPMAIGTKALGIIGNNLVVTVQTSSNVWTPVAWLT